MIRVELTDATDEQVQIAARSMGGDERGLMNLIESDDPTPDEVGRLRAFLTRCGVTAITDDNGFVSTVRPQIKWGPPGVSSQETNDA